MKIFSGIKNHNAKFDGIPNTNSGLVGDILNARIVHKRGIVVNFNNWSILCKQLWIGSLAVLFWHVIKMLFLENSNKFHSWSITLVNRAIFCGVGLTVLFWCIDGVSWYFQRQLRKDIEEMEFYLWQLNNSDSPDYLGLSEWGYLTGRETIDSKFLFLNQPTFWSAAFNKSLFVYMGMCLFLSLINLISYIIVNRDLCHIIYAGIGIAILWFGLIGWYNDTSHQTKVIDDYHFMKGRKKFLVAVVVGSICLLYIGITSILMKFLYIKKEELSFEKIFYNFFSLFNFPDGYSSKNVTDLGENIPDYSQGFENMIIFLGLFFFCALILIMAIRRVEKLVARSKEKLKFMNQPKSKILVLYPVAQSKVSVEDLRIFYRKLATTNNHTVFIDCINNYNNQITADREKLINEKILASDYIFLIDLTDEQLYEQGYDVNFLKDNQVNKVFISFKEFKNLCDESPESFRKFINIKL
ncbi:TPA: hypothetical protein VB840_000561 [Streptococcus suis]|nr:hypothetical protein [Streptococcus suis]HEP1787794.1 hypothetical protein [Streptococcus suis]HEP1803145.1 hypothetical protein [Streptococcus suis]